MTNSSDNTVIIGTTGNDNIYANAGTHRIQGAAGSDYIVINGTGNNLINGDYGSATGWILNDQGLYVDRKSVV